MIKIRNFTQVEQFIKQNSNRAMELSGQWSEFARKQPIVHQFQSFEQFQRWADGNPQLAIDTSIWAGREVQAAFSEIRYNNVRSQYDPQQRYGRQGAGPAGLLLAGPLALFMRNRPEILQDDPKFKKIQEQLKSEWLKNNPGKTLDSQEGVNYVYGSLDDENAASLDNEAERLFREKHQKEAEKYDKKRLKVYKNPADDPALRRTKERMAEHAKARGEWSGKIEQHGWDRFVALFPEKAEKYADKNLALLYALNRARERQMMEGQQIEDWGESGAPTVEEYQPLVEPSPDEESYEPPSPSPQPAISPDKLATPPSQPARQEKSPHKPSTGGLPNPKTLLNNLPRLPKGLATLIKNVRTVANIAKLFANPVGVGVLIAVLLITIFTLIILLAPRPETDRFPGEMEEGPIPTLPPGTTADCPVPGANITFGSYGTGPKAHCTEAFEGCQFGPNGELPRRAKSIDIDTQGKGVIFPTIAGEQVGWSYLNGFELDKPGDCEGGVSNCGSALIFDAKTKDNTRWVLHLLHIDKNTVSAKIYSGTNSSGVIVGKTAINTINGKIIPVVLHVNIGRNIKNAGFPPPGGGDFDSGWIKPEDLGMCTK